MERVIKKILIDKKKFDPPIKASDLDPFLKDEKKVNLFKLVTDLDFVRCTLARNVGVIDCDISLNAVTKPSYSDMGIELDQFTSSFIINLNNYERLIPKRKWEELGYRNSERGNNSVKFKVIEPDDLKEEILKYISTVEEYKKEVLSESEKNRIDVIKEYFKEELEE